MLQKSLVLLLCGKLTGVYFGEKAIKDEEQPARCTSTGLEGALWSRAREKPSKNYNVSKTCFPAWLKGLWCSWYNN